MACRGFGHIENQCRCGFDPACMGPACMGPACTGKDKRAVPQRGVHETAVADEDAGESDYDAIRYQGDYTQELIDETDYPSFNVDGACV